MHPSHGIRRCLSFVALAGALVLSSCQYGLTPIAAPVAGATCPTGTWALSDSAINAAVTKLGGALASNLKVTLNGNGVSVKLNADNTWSLTANQTGSFTGTVMGGLPVSGTGVIKASASGTYTKAATTLTFKVAAISGSLDVSASVNGGATQSLSFPLTKANADDNDLEIDDVVGLNGTANYTCGADGTLTLGFTTNHIDMKFHR
jgi:hypothetical protein